MSDAGRIPRRAVAPAFVLVALLLAPPLVWLVAFQVVYSIAAFGCDTAVSKLPMHATMVAALMAIAVAAAVSWRHVRANRSTPSGDDDGSRPRAYFLSLGGLVLAVQFSLAVLGQELAVMLLGPCP